MYTKLRCKVGSTPYVEQTSGFTYRAHIDLDSRHQIYRTAYGVVKGGNPAEIVYTVRAPHPRLRNVNGLMEIMHGLVLFVRHKCGHLRFSNIICFTENKGNVVGRSISSESRFECGFGIDYFM
jgi:hypothetical protein